MSAGPPREADQLEGVKPPEQQQVVFGHEEARARLRQLQQHGRLPGGILFHGPQGIGKATLAFQLAREIFAQTGDEEPGNIAQQVASGGYPNLRVLRRAPRESGKGFYSEIRVGEVRDLIERLRRTRGRAGHRVVIVDAIDDCNASSANALLKILEEPPPETSFFLVSHRPGSLLPTIRSRCHGLALRPLDVAAIRDVVAANRADVAADALDAAVALADGRPRRALEALLMSDTAALAGLRAWLADPSAAPTTAHLGLADALGGERDGAQGRFARDILFGWIAAEARAAAEHGAPSARLASVTELWDKAHALFEDSDTYNLDLRQTLVSLFDAIRKHVQSWTVTIEPT